jgi:hypothetical protein
VKIYSVVCIITGFQDHRVMTASLLLRITTAKDESFTKHILANIRKHVNSEKSAKKQAKATSARLCATASQTFAKLTPMSRLWRSQIRMYENSSFMPITNQSPAWRHSHKKPGHARRKAKWADIS